jgi:hypothetical protein
LTPEGKPWTSGRWKPRAGEAVDEQKIAGGESARQEELLRRSQEQTQSLLERLAGTDPEKRKIVAEVLTGLSDRALVTAARKPATTAKDTGLGLPIEYDDAGRPVLNGQPVALQVLRERLAQARGEALDAQRPGRRIGSFAKRQEMLQDSGNSMRPGLS